VLLALVSVRVDARQATATALAAQVLGSTVVLTWQGNASSWVLEAGTGPGLTNIAVSQLSSPAATVTIPNVPAGTYYVRVRGVLLGVIGAASNEVVVQVGSAPPPPPIPCQVGQVDLRSSRNLLQLTLNWNEIGVVETVQLEVGTAPGLSNVAVLAGLPAIPRQFSAAGPPGVYWIRLRPFRACGAGTPSNEIAVELAPVPLPTCTPSLSPSNRFVAASGIYTVNVTVPAGCVWSVFTRDPGWITPITGQGSGPGVVQYRVTLPGGGSGQIYVTTLAGRYSVNVES
jgi:hypothetical protein